MVRIIYLFFIIISLCCSSGFTAEFALVKRAIETEGDWEKGVILEREVIFTKRNDTTSEIYFNIPGEGDYQLYAYVYHNWRKYSPFIYVEAEDSQGIRHTGYMFFEQCWYLDKDQPGRWLMHSPNAMPFWHLPKGKLSLTFSACGKKSIWDSRDVDMEDKIAIETFILAPVINNQRIISMGIIEPEFGRGRWMRQDYSDMYAAGLISSTLPGDISNSQISVTDTGDYMGVISLGGSQGHSIEISFTSGDFKQKISVKKKSSLPFWETLAFVPLHLSKGEYAVDFKNTSEKKDFRDAVLIDYLLLLPVTDYLAP